MLQGFWDWLFSGLETPIPMPKDISASSLFSFALQLMGITWPKVREILVKHIGRPHVEVIEAAWQLISVLIERGPQGLVELVKEQLTPENIVQTILEAAVQYLVETLIKQVIVRVIGMLNPVGAIAQAIDLIYQVCKWIFHNAARIFRFIEAVVNGLADVIAGNVSGLAPSVEQGAGDAHPAGHRLPRRAPPPRRPAQRDRRGDHQAADHGPQGPGPGDRLPRRAGQGAAEEAGARRRRQRQRQGRRRARQHRLLHR